MSKAPLEGIRVVEFAGLAPGPFAGLVLADWGASVIRVDRVDNDHSPDVLCRAKRSIAINPKVQSGRDVLRELVSRADILIDPFRPGVLEKLGLGPEVFLGMNQGLNKRLIYARLTGFPRTGPHKGMAGHDINYLALSGVLAMLPGSDRPTFPLNLLADFAGGGLICVLGILLALFERSKTGLGQVVHTDMVSGVRYLSSFPLLNKTYFADPRGTNLLDGGAPFYDVYTCSDGGWMSVGCLEPQFFRTFLEVFVTGLPPGFTLDGWSPSPQSQTEKDQWPKLREFMKIGFETNTRDYWAQVFHDTDACALPVLVPSEAAVEYKDTETAVPRPHPELTHTPAISMQQSMDDSLSLPPGRDTEEILDELGLDERQRRKLVSDGALRRTDKRAAKL